MIENPEGRKGKKKKRFGLWRCTKIVLPSFLFFLAVVQIGMYNNHLLLTFGVHPVSHATTLRDESAKDVIVLMAMVTNDSFNLVSEWVKHHKAMVDKIVLYDDTPKINRSVAGSLSTIFSREIEEGSLSVYEATDWDGQLFILGTTYMISETKKPESLERTLVLTKKEYTLVDLWQRYLQEMVPGEHIWLTHLELDEFFNPQIQSLNAIIRTARLNGATAFRVQKKQFGPSQHIKPPTPYSLRDKYFFRETNGEFHAGGAILSAITGVLPGCSHIYQTHSLIQDFLTGSFECELWRNELEGQISNGIQHFHPKKEIVVNHYLTRSFEECFASSEETVREKCLSRTFSVCDSSILKDSKSICDKEVSMYEKFMSTRSRMSGIERCRTNIENLFQYNLCRFPTAAERASWTQECNARTINMKGLHAHLRSLDEHRDCGTRCHRGCLRTSPLHCYIQTDIIYKSYLCRVPDEVGYQRYVKMCLTGELGIEEIRQKILSSEEYKNRCARGIGCGKCRPTELNEKSFLKSYRGQYFPFEGHKSSELWLGNNNLKSGDFLESENRKYRLYMQTDNNLCLRKGEASEFVWGSDTGGKGSTPAELKLIGINCSVVIADSSNSILWSVHGKEKVKHEVIETPCKLKLSNNGVLVLSDATGLGMAVIAGF
mmetsp:Transcript_14013/g.21209  ORF Transcript_14013/g.21209 Transcript_14013/m.21209 type:complete len:660 (-) Transcript_14013:69-2048(-)